jgi:hypothetical protein
MLTNALIINVLVLFAVLEADLGATRKVTRLRLLRPLLLAVAIVPLFLGSPQTHGTGLALELGGAVAGILLGLGAAALMSVRREPASGRLVTRAGFGYAGLWITVIGARSLFSIGATHWFNHALTTWCAQNNVTGNAITDGLIVMALGMTLTRTLGLAIRAGGIGREAPAVGAAS